MIWPNPIVNSTSLGAWLNKLRAAAQACEIKPGVGYRINKTAQGITLDLSNNAPVEIQTLRVKTMADEYMVCRTWDGTNEGSTDIRVAKGFNARQPASETIAGTTYTYTYSSGPDALNDYRDSNDGSTTEQQVVVPFWIADGMILVAKTNYSGVTAAGADLKLIEVSSRCWAKVTA